MAASRKTSSCTTYHELQTTESRGQFSCLLCLQPSFCSTPMRLDCNHAFCERCIQSYYQLYSLHLGTGNSASSSSSPTTTTTTANGSVTSHFLLSCPTCGQVTQLRDENGEQQLLQHQQQLLILSPANGNGNGDAPHFRKASMALDSSCSQRCDSCIARRRIEVADFYCNKCSLNLCNTCKLIHDQQTLFSAHVVIHISNKDTVSLGCDIHGGRHVCTYYCYDCDVPACAICLLHEHGPPMSGVSPSSRSLPCTAHGTQTTTGHRTAKLQDALSTRRDALKTLLNCFGPRLDRLEARMKRLSNSSQCATGSSSNSVGRPGHRCHNSSTYNGSMAGGKSFTASYSANASGASSPLLGRRFKQASHPALDDGDNDSSDGNEDDVKENEMHCVRFFIINNVSHCDSHSSEDNNNDDDVPEISDTEIDIDVANSSWNRHCVMELVAEQLSRLRRLFDKTTRLLELAQSRRLLAVQREVTSRLQTVNDFELPALYMAVTDLLDNELLTPTPTASSTKSNSAGSNSSIASNGQGVGWAHTRHSSGVSGTSTIAVGSPDPAGFFSYAKDVVSECPLSLLVRPKLVWKSEKQKGTDEMWNPCSVAFLSSRDHSVVVAEYDMNTTKNNKLRIFDASGKTRSVLLQGQLQPLGVAVTRDEYIAVTDGIGKRIKIINPTTGQVVSDIGKGQFGWPYGIAVNSRGHLVVTDAFNDSVSIYNPADGKRIRQFGSSGSRDNNLRNPYHVTVDGSDNILVSDSGNDCIKAFDPTGKFLFRCDVTTPGASSPVGTERRFRLRRNRGGSQRTGGRLRGPRGISVDLRGHILVADDCSRICMFESDGRYMRNLLTDEDLVKFPEAVHCSRVGTGQLAVTEYNPNSMFAVKVFNLYE